MPILYKSLFIDAVRKELERKASILSPKDEIGDPQKMLPSGPRPGRNSHNYLKRSIK
jgi:hypothetical protein